MTLTQVQAGQGGEGRKWRYIELMTTGQVQDDQGSVNLDATVLLDIDILKTTPTQVQAGQGGEVRQSWHTAKLIPTRQVGAGQGGEE